MAGDEEKVSQDEIEALLNQSRSGGASPPPAAAAKPAAEDADKILGQGEIEALLASKKSPASAAAPRPSSAAPMATTAAAPPPGQIAPGDVELLLRQAEQALASIDAAGPSLPTGATSFKFEEFTGAPP